ncbi:hypothetical protein P7L75_05380 (plasmid) [Tistrella mobilis]|uniref:hypothetical protein n=1 Tax=Tistrella mobilis TaxID=171437 RepID=UPI00355767CE
MRLGGRLGGAGLLGRVGLLAGGRDQRRRGCRHQRGFGRPPGLIRIGRFRIRQPGQPAARCGIAPQIQPVEHVAEAAGGHFTAAVVDHDAPIEADPVEQVIALGKVEREEVGMVGGQRAAAGCKDAGCGLGGEVALCKRCVRHGGADLRGRVGHRHPQPVEQFLPVVQRLAATLFAPPPGRFLVLLHRAICIQLRLASGEHRGIAGQQLDLGFVFCQFPKPRLGGGDVGEAGDRQAWLAVIGIVGREDLLVGTVFRRSRQRLAAGCAEPAAVRNPGRDQPLPHDGDRIPQFEVDIDLAAGHQVAVQVDPFHKAEHGAPLRPFGRSCCHM